MQGYIILGVVFSIAIIAVLTTTKLLAKELGAKNATWLSSIFANILIFFSWFLFNKVIINSDFLVSISHHQFIIFLTYLLLSACVIAIILKMTYFRALAVAIGSIVSVCILAFLGFVYAGSIAGIITFFNYPNSFSKFW